MKRLVGFVAIAVATAALQQQLFADEVWTFQFTPTGSRPFSSHCPGDCGQDYGSRADVVGTFSILLNRQTGAGKPLVLNGQLVNVMASLFTSSGSILLPDEPPYYKMLPSELVLDQSPGHFIYQQNGLWRLIPDNFSPEFAAFERYDIWFTLTAATFSASLPYDFFATPRIQGAFASLVSITTAGDFNSDTRIDARDYVSWRKSAGTPTNYNLWRSYFGNTSASAVTNGRVPEPSALLLASLCLYITMCFRGRHQRQIAQAPSSLHT
jgi:hypothetical protein